MNTRTALIATISSITLTACALLPGTSAYVGQEFREIKSLSASDVEGYLAGRGMGLAKAAEMNGYPGPMHVLELRSRLALTPEQQTATEALFGRMQQAAITQGKALMDAERDLDRLFREQVATPDSLDRALARVADAQARVRGAHLQAHIEQTKILSVEQARLYSQLRGYSLGG